MKISNIRIVYFLFFTAGAAKAGNSNPGDKIAHLLDRHMNACNFSTLGEAGQMYEKAYRMISNYFRTQYNKDVDAVAKRVGPQCRDIAQGGKNIPLIGINQKSSFTTRSSSPVPSTYKNCPINFRNWNWASSARATDPAKKSTYFDFFLVPDSSPMRLTWNTFFPWDGDGNDLGSDAGTRAQQALNEGFSESVVAGLTSVCQAANDDQSTSPTSDSEPH